MKFRPLGRTGLDVSLVCMGTMTFGEQNSQDEAFEQLDYAFAEGVNFVDTAEMYSVPVKPETYGRTEEIIGAWMKARGNRDKVVLATKILGPGDRFPTARNGARTRLDAAQVRIAVEQSLKRLGTDYIDLYQTHWPDRGTNTFGKLNYEHDDNEESTPVAETLGALADMVKEGKIRHVGVSNETPWGLHEHLKISESEGLPRIASIQNPYNLINRTFEVGTSEFAIREDVGLLAYGCLASGMLTGKYLGGAKPEGARLTRWPDYFPRYLSPTSFEAAEKYVALAKQHGLDPSALALAFCGSRRFMTSVIIGATTMAQLKVNVGAVTMDLSPDVIEGIEAINAERPNAYL
jgi:aryl-alcohol dehydrogenase-like predicted oxidoreductase